MRMVGPSAKGAFHLDTRVFQDQIRRHLAQTSRQLDKATNARLFYWLLRAFAILPPKDPKAERARIGAYMREPLSARTTTSRSGKVKVAKAGKQLQRRHLIAQARNKAAGNKGLYGQEMKDAAAAVLRKAVGSVGYLKSPLVKAMKKLNGHFTQFGRKRKKGKDVPPNKALADIAGKYGLAVGGNVGVHRGAKASVRLAQPGLSPVAVANISTGVEDSQAGKVNGFYNQAFNQAMIDEIEELRFHMADVVQASADEQFNK